MISTTIKRFYMDQILSGKKRTEFKEYNEYWCKRLPGNRSGIINFLCGQISYKYTYTDIEVVLTPIALVDVIKTPKCFAIHLGERISDISRRSRSQEG